MASSIPTSTLEMTMTDHDGAAHDDSGEPGFARQAATINGNPGRPQSDFEFEDAEPAPDPSEFPASEDHEVVPGTTAPTDAD
jgi:hypothetical protein